MGPSKGPKLLMFERFQQQWPHIDTLKFKRLENINIDMTEEIINTIVLGTYFVEENKTKT